MKRFLTLFAACALLASACSAPRTKTPAGSSSAASSAASTTTTTTSTGTAPSAHAGPSAAAAPNTSAPAAAPTTLLTPAVPAAPATNRDAHGNPDIVKYIALLQSDSRVADLDVPTVLATLALPEDAVIGDLGCGPGVFSLAFAKACPSGVIYASDIEPAQLDAVRAKIHEQHVHNVVPVLASLDEPHFPPGTLDLVFIADTYHHLDQRVAYMQQLARVLKPGGRVAILEYKSGQLPVGPPPAHKLAAGVREKELADAGYVLTQSFTTHPWHDFELWRPVHPWEKSP